MYSILERFVFLAWLWIIILALAQTSYAGMSVTPKGNVTIKTYGDATFASEPHGRGTVGVLVSCTATFIFCIWTAVHPNVVPGVRASKRLYYKGVLMIVSVFIPEGLVVCSLGEYRQARRLLKAWRECPNIQEEFKDYMDMRVAFFVVMGGFIVDENVKVEGSRAPKPGMLWRTTNFLRWIFCVEQEEPPQAVQSRSIYRARLTPTGFKKYMEMGLIHEQSFKKADILDKGKASTFGKFLAAVQALWLVVQSASRMSAGLPLSLLEIHVLIHVARTAFIYFFWWYKPLDVNEPIRIYLDKRAVAPDQEKSNTNVSPAVERSGSIYPYYANSSQNFGIQPVGSPAPDSTYGSLASRYAGSITRFGSPELHRQSVIDFDLSPMGQWVRGPSPLGDHRPPGVPLSQQNRSESDILEEDYSLDPLSGELNGRGRLDMEIEHSKKYRRNEPKFITFRSPQSFILFHNKAIYDIIIQLDVGEREGRKERNQAAAGPGHLQGESYSHYTSRSLPLSRTPQPESQTRPASRTVQRTPTFQSRLSMPHIMESPQATKDAFRFSFVLFYESLLVCLTGALHALAWNKHFPSTLERWLWRSSSLTMCACCLGLFFIANFTEYEQDLIEMMWEFHIGLEPDDGFFTTVRKGIKRIHIICLEHARGSKRHENLRYILHQCGVILAIIFITIYFLSVSFITVESYLSLREVTPDMWLTPSLTDYWPHL